MGRMKVGRRGLAVGAILLLALVGSTAALAGKPVTEPVPPGTTELEPGQACPFAVTIATQPGSKWWLTTFDNGTEVTTGAGREKVTNVTTSRSVTVPTAGLIRTSPLAGGGTRLQAIGATVFYFYEGDVGPYGLVPEGSGGALYHVVGVVDETLSADDVVTSFRWFGKATELCGKVS